jgi:hypothetical protein
MWRRLGDHLPAQHLVQSRGLDDVAGFLAKFIRKPEALPPQG